MTGSATADNASQLDHIPSVVSLLASFGLSQQANSGNHWSINTGLSTYHTILLSSSAPRLVEYSRVNHYPWQATLSEHRLS